MKHRVTYVGTVYFGGPDEQPSATSHTSCRPVEAAEEPFERDIPVDGGWTALSGCWLKQASLIHLEVKLPKWQVVPSKEERDRAEALVVEVGIQAGDAVLPFALLKPGAAPLILEPYDLHRIRVRCTAGKTRVHTVVMPR